MLSREENPSPCLSLILMVKECDISPLPLVNQLIYNDIVS